MKFIENIGLVKEREDYEVQKDCIVSDKYQTKRPTLTTNILKALDNGFQDYEVK